MMEKYKIGAEGAWIYLEEHKFDVDKALTFIEGGCQVSILNPKTMMFIILMMCSY